MKKTGSYIRSKGYHCFR